MIMLVNNHKILQNHFKENGEQNVYFIMCIGIIWYAEKDKTRVIITVFFIFRI